MLYYDCMYLRVLKHTFSIVFMFCHFCAITNIMLIYVSTECGLADFDVFASVPVGLLIVFYAQFDIKCFT